jgi:hypothetical protein
MAKRRIRPRFNQKTHRPGSKNFGKIIRPMTSSAQHLAIRPVPCLDRGNSLMERKASSKPEFGAEHPASWHLRALTMYSPGSLNKEQTKFEMSLPRLK